MTPYNQRVVAVLDGARDLLRAGWCQYDQAQNAQGRGVMWGDPAAVAFALDGAVYRACEALGLSSRGAEAGSVEFYLRRATRPYTPFEWGHWKKITQADVLAAVAQARADVCGEAPPAVVDADTVESKDGA